MQRTVVRTSFADISRSIGARCSQTAAELAEVAKEKVQSWQKNEHQLAIAEAIVFSAVLAAGLGSHDHFTWWGLGIVIAYDVGVAISHFLHGPTSRAVGRAVYTQEWFSTSFWGIPFLSELVIALGVMLMSARGCALLAELYYENKLLYIFGNFAVHYWPLVRLLLFIPDEGPALVRPALIAASIVITYTLYFQPRYIYKCPTSRFSTVLGLLIPIAVVGLVAAFAPTPGR